MKIVKRVNHQFSLFGFQKPKAKVPISAERIREAKALVEAGKHKDATVAMREVRYGLENYLKRMK